MSLQADEICQHPSQATCTEKCADLAREIKYPAYWIYKNKKTGETVKSNCIDSRYWNSDWDCIESYMQDIFKNN